MARKKYYYDTETCRFEPVKVSKVDVALNLTGLLFASVAIGIGLVFSYQTLFPTEKEVALKEENKQLLEKYELLDKELSSISSMLGELQHRDDNIYRVIFEAEPIAKEVRRGGSGGTRGSQLFQSLLNQDLAREDVILGSLSKIEQLKKQMFVQTKSYDKIIALCKDKEAMSKAIPAIQPLPKRKNISFASGFGMRMHPIYKTMKMHTGVDISAPTGTPIYAAGDGKVIKAEWGNGYGNEVEIDHGFGYITKYAHMSAFSVKQGQKVKRGQEIGKVGSTGTSVSPHLHYEVIHNGEKVNPVHYFFKSLTPDEYNDILKQAKMENQSLGGGPCGHTHH